MRRASYYLTVTLVAAVAGWLFMSWSGTAYVAKRSDNVCGLREVHQLSHPARVDYPRLIAVTPEWKRIDEDRIDPESAQGQVLLARARSRVLNAADHVRRQLGHCSIWRKIRRRDGEPVPDVTENVVTRLRQVVEEQDAAAA